MEQQTFIDCSETESNDAYISKLNTYIQLNKNVIDFKHIASGPPHASTFTTTTLFEGVNYKCMAKSKKECERKIRTRICDIIFKVQNELKKNKKLAEHTYKDFAITLAEIDFSKYDNVIFVDVENSGTKALQLLMSFATTLIICVYARLTSDEFAIDITSAQCDFVLIKRSDYHVDSADEGITRIIYYLADNKHISSRMFLITKDNFGQRVKDSLTETEHSITNFATIESCCKFLQK